MYLTVLCFSSLFLLTQSQLTSPCPKVFNFDSQHPENLSWYGTINLNSPSELQGVWLRIVFDRAFLKLGNWFGEIKTEDNKNYLIKNPQHKLIANSPFPVKFFVEYDTLPPQIEMVRLNGRVICPEGTLVEATTVPIGEPLTSSILSSTTPPNAPDVFALQFPEQPEVACGTVVQKPTPLISKGQITEPGQWPWHAALYYTQNAQLTYSCGATLLSENFVITAAHCITKPRSNKIVDKDLLLLYFGKYSLKKFGEGVQDREVSRIFLHPEYNSSLFFNDIAILKMKNSVDFTDFVRPCCLWEESDSLDVVVDKLGTVVGWGFDENHNLADILMQAQMPVVSHLKCIYSNPDFFSRFTFNKNFCAGFRNGTSACNGDSGGGMVFAKAGNKKVWQLRGIVSLSVALQDQAVCDSEHFVIFTDVAKHLDWIKKVIGR